MDDVIPVRDQNLLRRLRRMRVLVVHPDDHERHIFIAHLKRIGCQVESVWPAPSQLPDHVDVLLFLLTQINENDAIARLTGENLIARIAIISFETPEILSEIERLSVHGVLSKPIRLFGVLAALTTAIGVGRYESRLKRRIESLDETLKARRKIEQAVSILAENRGINQEEAYKRLRDKSQTSQTPISKIAEAIIAAADI